MDKLTSPTFLNADGLTAVEADRFRTHDAPTEDGRLAFTPGDPEVVQAIREGIAANKFGRKG